MAEVKRKEEREEEKEGRERGTKSKKKKETGENQRDEAREPYFRRACHSSPSICLQRCPLT